MWKWEVAYRCRECTQDFYFEIGESTTKAEVLEHHGPDKKEKYCPLCGQGKAQLMSIKLVGNVDLHDSAL